MIRKPAEHTLEFLLAFDGRVHWLEKGYRIEFAIKRVTTSKTHPHGLRYSLTLHDPTGNRLLGFDNAHAVAPTGSRFRRRSIAADHWHRTESDPGRPYHFTDADALLQDFFREARRILAERGVVDTVVRIEEEREDRRGRGTMT
jgi:hypothetical protein